MLHSVARNIAIEMVEAKTASIRDDGKGNAVISVDCWGNVLPDCYFFLSFRFDPGMTHRDIAVRLLDSARNVMKHADRVVNWTAAQKIRLAALVAKLEEIANGQE